MFYAVMAALAGTDIRLPETHSGAISLFGRHYVRTGKIGSQFAGDLRNAYNLRLQGGYGLSTEAGEEQVRAAVGRAEAFVAQVKHLLE
jgi:uncharacterized protein (UPF0332 family)